MNSRIEEIDRRIKSCLDVEENLSELDLLLENKEISNLEHKLMKQTILKNKEESLFKEEIGQYIDKAINLKNKIKRNIVFGEFKSGLVLVALIFGMFLFIQGPAFTGFVIAEVSDLAVTSSFGTNTTDENITAAWTATDDDGDPVINITDWRINDTSIAILNLPFEKIDASVDIVSNPDFENGTLGSCPTGWTCTGDAMLAAEGDAQCGDGSGSASGGSGNYYGKAGCDSTLGTLTSNVFSLPYGTTSFNFFRAGGADDPSGFYVKSAVDDSEVCSSKDGTDSDAFFYDTCTGISESDWGTPVYIYIIDDVNGGWGKTYVDNISIVKSFSVDETRDYNSHPHGGMVADATFTSAGKYGGAYEFNKTTSQINITDSLGLTLEIGKSTVTAWVKPTLLHDYGNIFWKSTDGSSDGWGLITQANGNWSFQSSGGSWSNISGGVLQDGVWSFIAVVYNGTHVHTYTNGILVNETAKAKPTDNSAPLIIGMDPVNSRNFNGTIDDVIIYNRELSYEQILLLNKSQKDTILSQETEKAETWIACITPNDGNGDGATVCSNEILIDFNDAPIISSANISSAYGRNVTTENLTVSSASSDTDGNSIHNVTDWRINGTSIAIVNLPFEPHPSSSTVALDYSTHDIDATVSGATFSSTSGYDGHGAYITDGSSNYIHADTDIMLDSSSKLSLFFWVNLTEVDENRGIFHLNDYLTGDGAICIFINDASGTLQFYVDDGYREASATLAAGVWTHIGLTFDGSTWRFYKDGSQLSSYSGGTAWCDSAVNDVYLGVGYNNYHDAIYDSFIMYNRNLSDEQIQFLYRNRTDSISYQETRSWENWTACVTPNDQYELGNTVCSNEIIVLPRANNVSVASNVILNSTHATNTTRENLTVYWTSSDDAEDDIFNVTDWRLNGTSIALVNMPFGPNLMAAARTLDYSTYGNNGTISGAMWNSTGGFDRSGAYSFGGVGTGNKIALDKPLPDSKETTLVAWVYYTGGENWGTLFSDDDPDNSEYYYVMLTEAGIQEIRVIKGASNVEIGVAKNIGNAWHHIAWTMNSTESNVYIDGSLETTQEGGANIGYHADNPQFGMRGDSSAEFGGYIDEFKLFDRALSQEEVLNIFKNQSHIMSHIETKIGENWTACITPNDDLQTGATVCSNNLTIVDKVTITQIYPNETEELLPIEDSTINVSVIRHVNNTNMTFNISATADESSSITITWFVNSISEFIETILSGAMSVFSYLFNVVGLYNVTAVANASGGTDTFTFYLNVSNNLSTVYNVMLNSTLLMNSTYENLTVYWSSSDSDNDPIVNITDWRINSTSIAVLNMPFEGGSNTTFTRDYSTYGNNGSVSEAIWGANGGYNGKGAYSFDGYDDYIDCGSSNSLKIIGDITVGAWIRLNATTFPDASTNWHIVHNEVYQSSGWMFRIMGASPVMWYRSSQVGTAQDLVSNNPLENNKWYYVAFVKNNNVVTFYLNGVADGGGTASTPVTPAINLYLSAPGQAMNGKLDNVQIFNRALSPEEILLLYQNRTDIISEKETFTGENWTACITPNDGFQDGLTVCSNNLTINGGVTLWSYYPDQNGALINITDEINETLTRIVPANIDFNLTAIFGTTLTHNWYLDDVLKYTQVVNSDTPSNYSYYFDTAGYHNVSVVVNGSVYKNETFTWYITLTEPSTITDLVLNSSFLTNTTLENITAYWTSSSINITDWRVNGDSIAVLNMPFEANNGQEEVTANDYSTYDNDGTVSGAEWESNTGREGTGVSNFSSLDTITVLNAAELNAINNRSWELLIKPVGNTATITEKADASDGWQLALSVGKVIFSLIKSSTTHKSESPSAIDVGTWHHLFVNFYEGEKIEMYVDGVLVNTSITTHVDVSNAEDLVIGGGHTGLIDYIRIYNRTFTSEQIKHFNLSRYDIIDDNETITGEEWGLAITPNSGGDGTPAYSNNITILNVIYINSAYPNASNESQAITTETSFSIVRNVSSNISFNITASSEDYETLTFSWFVDQVLKTTYTIISNFIGWFSWIFEDAGDHNVTVIVNGSLSAQRNFTFEIGVACYDGDGDGFNVSGSNCGYIDCDDTDPLIRPAGTNPINGDEGILFCPGTYYVYEQIDIKGGSNIEITCNETIMVGDATTGLSKYNVTNSNNITIKDCTFINFGIAIYFANTTNSSIYNNLFFNNTGCVSELTVENNRIYNNTFNSTTVSGYSINDNNARNTTIEENNFYRHFYSVTLEGSANVSIRNNNMMYVNRPLQISAFSFENVVRNNTINTSITASLQIADSWKNLIIENKIFGATNESYGFGGITIAGTEINCENNTIENNTIFGSRVEAINVAGGANFNTFRNNTIVNVSDNAIEIGNSKNNTFIDNEILKNTGSGFYLSSGPSGTKIINNTIFNSNYGIEISGEAPTQIISNKIFNNSQGGISLTGGASFNLIAWNIFENNSIGGIYASLYPWYPSSRNIIHNNTFKNNTNGIYFQGYGAALNNISDNIFSDNIRGILLGDAVNNTIFKNTFNDNTIDISSPNSTGNSLFWYERNNSMKFEYKIINITKIENIHINDSVAAVNLSAEVPMNQTANITTVNFIYSCSNYSIRYNTSYQKSYSAISINRGFACGPNYCTDAKCYGSSGNITVMFNANSWSTYFISNNSLPYSNVIFINSTYATNFTNENLTVYYNSSDEDGDLLYNITDWRINETSIAVLNMPFEANYSTSTLTKDYSSYGNVGTVTGAVFDAYGGHDGRGAYIFNGSYYIEKDTQLVGNYPFTYSAWIKTTDARDQIIISLEDKDVANIVYAMGISSTGGIRLYVENGAANHIGGASSGFADGNWHLFVAVFNSSGLRKLYVDGVSKGSHTTSIDYNAAVDRFSIGRKGTSSPDEYFNGTIDGVMIFNRALSLEQILQLNLSRSDFIVRNETITGENWTACVTPNDGKVDGITSCSNKITIRNYIEISSVYPNQSSLWQNIIADETNLTIMRNASQTENLTFNATITADAGTFTFSWFVNQVLEFVEVVTSGFMSFFSQLFDVGGIYNVSVTVNSTEAGVNDSFTWFLNVTRGPPIIDWIWLNSTYATNYTNENLTVYWNVTDPDGDDLVNITDWRINGTSIAVLNVPFEGGSNSTWTKDYSTFGNNGTVVGAVWNATGGYDGNGDYEFDPEDSSQIVITDSSVFNFSTNNFTLSSWIKTEDVAVRLAIAKYGGAGDDYWLGIYTDGKAAFSISGSPAVSTESIADGNWHMVVGVRNSSLCQIYVDGVLNSSNGCAGDADPTGELYIGARSDGYYFNGSIDNVQIFNRALSPEEILLLYQNKTDIMSEKETFKGENWSVCITPNDGIWDGNTLCSNNLTIRNTPPSAPSLSNPNDGNNTLISLNVTFNWTESSDYDNDGITYYLNVTSEFCSNNYFGPISALNFTSPELNVVLDCGYYNWTVGAYDGENYNWSSSIFNFSIAPYIDVFLIDNYNLSDFGNMGPNEQNDTVDSNPVPFIVQSDSNVKVNVTVRALDELWDSSGIGNTSFMFSVGNSTELDSFVEANSQRTFIPLNWSAVLALNYLDWHNSTDTGEVEFNITVPDAEPPGQKTANVIVEGVRTPT